MKPEDVFALFKEYPDELLRVIDTAFESVEPLAGLTEHPEPAAALVANEFLGGLQLVVGAGPTAAVFQKIAQTVVACFVASAAAVVREPAGADAAAAAIEKRCETNSVFRELLLLLHGCLRQDAVENGFAACRHVLGMCVDSATATRAVLVYSIASKTFPAALCGALHLLVLDQLEKTPNAVLQRVCEGAPPDAPPSSALVLVRSTFDAHPSEFLASLWALWDRGDGAALLAYVATAAIFLPRLFEAVLVRVLERLQSAEDGLAAAIAVRASAGCAVRLQHSARLAACMPELGRPGSAAGTVSVPLALWWPCAWAFLCQQHPSALPALAAGLQELLAHRDAANLASGCCQLLAVLVKVVEGARLQALGAPVAVESLDAHLVRDVGRPGAAPLWLESEWVQKWQQAASDRQSDLSRLLFSQRERSEAFAQVCRLALFEKAHCIFAGGSFADNASAQLSTEIAHILLNAGPAALEKTGWSWSWVHDAAAVAHSYAFFVAGLSAAVDRVLPKPAETAQLPYEELLFDEGDGMSEAKGNLASNLARFLQTAPSLPISLLLVARLADAIVALGLDAAVHAVAGFTEKALQSLPGEASPEEILGNLELLLRACSKSPRATGRILDAWAAAQAANPTQWTRDQFQRVFTRVFERVFSQPLAQVASSIGKSRPKVENDSFLALFATACAAADRGAKEFGAGAALLGDALIASLDLHHEPASTETYEFCFPEVVWYARVTDGQHLLRWSYDLEVWARFAACPMLWNVTALVVRHAKLAAESPLASLVQSLLAALVAFWHHGNHQSPPQHIVQLQWTQTLVAALGERLDATESARALRTTLALIPEATSGAQISQLLHRVAWPILQTSVLNTPAADATADAEMQRTLDCQLRTRLDTWARLAWLAAA